MMSKCDRDVVSTKRIVVLFILLWSSESLANAAHITTTSSSTTTTTTTTTTTPAGPLRHIISFINQKKTNTFPNNNNTVEIILNSTGSMDVEFKKNLSYQANIIRLALKRLRLPIDDFESNIIARQIQDDNQDGIDIPLNNNSTHKMKKPHTPKERPSFANNFWHHARSRSQSSEPLRNLLNTIRDHIHGNRSVALTPQYHKKSHSMHLLNPHQNSSGSSGHDEHHESAIETENERIMINESTGFHVLELLGTIAGLAWGFLTNLQGVFAASSGSSSGASSGK